MQNSIKINFSGHNKEIVQKIYKERIKAFNNIQYWQKPKKKK